MAFAIIQKPGSKYGPCELPCEHRDCAESRHLAAQLCPECKGPIAYGIPFVAMGDQVRSLYHLACAEEMIERQRKELVR